MPLITSIHFTPDGVSGPRYVITINIALLTEGDTQPKVGVNVFRLRLAC